MFSLGPIKWLGPYIMGSVAFAFIAQRVMEALFSGAHEAVHSAVFRRGIRSGRNGGSDE